MSAMSVKEAELIVAREDYLPWAMVAEAKKVLGIAEPKASEIWAELAKKGGAA